MKKIITAFVLGIACGYTNAALIFTDQAEFYERYISPAGVIDFASSTPLRNPAWSVGLTDYYQGESWFEGVVFETRSINGSVQQAVAKNRNDGEIRATDAFPNALLAIQQYRPQQILAIYSTAGFFGWVPELGTNHEGDSLFFLPEGARITSFVYGFSPAPIEVAESGTLPLSLLAMLGLWISRPRRAT